jgi:hypothetical protein
MNGQELPKMITQDSDIKLDSFQAGQRYLGGARCAGVQGVSSIPRAVCTRDFQSDGGENGPLTVLSEDAVSRHLAFFSTGLPETAARAYESVVCVSKSLQSTFFREWIFTDVYPTPLSRPLDLASCLRAHLGFTNSGTRPLVLVSSLT